MRVNISYSVELENVPTEVERILIECESKIRGIHFTLSQLTGQDPIKTLEGIDKIRLNLTAADVRLDDCMQILSGYIQTLAQLPQLKQGIPASAPEPPEENQDE